MALYVYAAVTMDHSEEPQECRYQGAFEAPLQVQFNPDTLYEKAYHAAIIKAFDKDWNADQVNVLEVRIESYEPWEREGE
jgi:hypothetical protein